VPEWWMPVVQADVPCLVNRSSRHLAGRSRPDRSELTPAEPVGSAKFKVSVRSVLELGAAIAAGLYVVLTVFYDRFYSPLGLEPGDVGLDRAAIVSRAVGGVIALIGLVFTCALAMLFLELFNWAVAAIGEWFIRRPTASMPEAEHDKYVARVARLRNNALIRIVGLLWPLPFITDPSRHPRPGRARAVSTIITVSAAAVILALGIGWQEVDKAAKAAKEGRTVTPLTILGVRVLDIESRPCVAEWLGESARKPVALQSAELRCLGVANGVMAFRAGASTITVPAGQVAITLK